MGAGILPLAIYKNNIYFFFSREAYIQKTKDSGKWSDFGGTKDNNETRLQTAVREGFEESTGLFESKKEIATLIKKNLVTKIHIPNYTTFIIEVPYNKDWSRFLKKNFDAAVKNDIQKVIDHNGLYEKDKGSWFKLESIKYKMHIFRPWYREIIKKLLLYFEKK